ncbi:MAG: carboxymuconolactone decarboxylase family protein [Alphaproteobacteria bacterium]|jgi:alkylhydroperoxidase family enzyme|nr:carboxymuconolactone decarboxylase family protein [Alphaproteobacteria bacterium]MDP6567456.1 carboxymuconolactone decarboxylase family protein [Alphaproteobacteria bacterium]
MARIDYVEPAQASGRVNELLDKLGHKNIFRMLGHSESHFQTYARMGNAIRFKGELDPQLREIAITRTGILCQAEYEVVAHKRLAREAGVGEEKIAALDEGAAADVFSEAEREVLRFTDEVVMGNHVADGTFDALARRLDPTALVELYLAIGYYIMTSKFLVTFGIDMQRD